MAAKNLLKQLKATEEGEQLSFEAQFIASKICFDTSINKQ